MASTFVIMILAEIADKTNLLALSLMSKTKQPKSVAFGGLLGIAVVTTIGILFGALIIKILPENVVPIISGLLFIMLGVLGIVKSDENEEIESYGVIEESNHKSTFAKSAFLIGFAEFGDKSQLFVITTSLVGDKIAVFLGAMAGMFVIMMITVFFGEKLIKSVPEDKLHQLASFLFIIVGIWILIL